MAILMVISVHVAGAHYFPGGAFGVDVFFVLSGFLITRLLIEEHRDTGRVSLRNFYGRRALRLLPALLIVLTFVAIAPRALSGVGTVGHLVNLRDVLGPLLYVYNWVLIAYFNTPMMMTHAWSLAVEEQFYVVWPVILIAILCRDVPAWRTSRWLFAVAVVAAAAMALRFGLGTSVVVLYHGTESHGLVMLMTGAALAFWFEHARRESWLYWVAKWTGPPSIVVICALVLAVDHGNRELYFGGWLAVATVIAVVLVAALDERSLVGRVLSLRLLRWFGMISYSLYLWHLPLLVLASAIMRPLGYGSMALSAIVVPTAIGLASASFYLVERPIVRFGRERLRAASRACHDNRVSHGWTKIGRCDHHATGKGTICESGHQHRRSFRLRPLAGWPVRWTRR